MCAQVVQPNRYQSKITSYFTTTTIPAVSLDSTDHNYDETSPSTTQNQPEAVSPTRTNETLSDEAQRHAQYGTKTPLEGDVKLSIHFRSQFFCANTFAQIHFDTKQKRSQ